MARINTVLVLGLIAAIEGQNYITQKNVKGQIFPVAKANGWSSGFVEHHEVMQGERTVDILGYPVTREGKAGFIAAARQIGAEIRFVTKLADYVVTPAVAKPGKVQATPNVPVEPAVEVEEIPEVVEADPIRAQLSERIAAMDNAGITAALKECGIVFGQGRPNWTARREQLLDIAYKAATAKPVKPATAAKPAATKPGKPSATVIFKPGKATGKPAAVVIPAAVVEPAKPGKAAKVKPAKVMTFEEQVKAMTDLTIEQLNAKLAAKGSKAFKTKHRAIAALLGADMNAVRAAMGLDAIAA